MAPSCVISDNWRICNLYTPSPRERISMRFQIGAPVKPYGTYVAPLKDGPYLRADGRIEVGQWGMIPPDSETRKPQMKVGRPKDGEKQKYKPLSTNNARRERLHVAKTYSGPWEGGQRCLIPAENFTEPYWGTDEHIAWTFARADGAPWALAGIWAEWIDPLTGEVVPSFSNDHPELRRAPVAEADAQAGAGQIGQRPSTRKARQAGSSSDRAPALGPMAQRDRRSGSGADSTSGA